MDHKCREYFERISEFFDNELEDSICEKIKSHLEDCPECLDCVGSLEKAIGLCKNVSAEDVPPGFHDRLMEKLKSCIND